MGVMMDLPMLLTMPPGERIEAGAFRTWMQLACLAGEDGFTPPLDLEELVRVTGKSRATLYRHLGRLKRAGLLDWTRRGWIIQVSLGGQGEAEAGSEAPEEAQEWAEAEAEPEGEEMRISILRESQICERASLKYLIKQLINLTREEARFSKSRIKRFDSQKCANERPKRGPPRVKCRCWLRQSESEAAARGGGKILTVWAASLRAEAGRRPQPADWSSWSGGE
jgi:DNA-binding transcriptional ArsR family regulator